MHIAPQSWPQPALDALLSPHASDVRFRRIGEALAKLCRHGGQGWQFYSLAQHSILVAEQLPLEWRGFGLVYEAHAAVVGDLPAPTLAALRAVGGGDAWDRFTIPHRAAIHRAAGLAWPIPPTITAAVRDASAIVFATEWRDIIGTPCPDDLPPPAKRRITPWAWPAACDRYLEALAIHCPGVGGLVSKEATL